MTAQLAIHHACSGYFPPNNLYFASLKVSPVGIGAQVTTLRVIPNIPSRTRLSDF